MRRRLALALLAILVILGVLASSRRLSPRGQRTHHVASTNVRGDSLTRVDSASRAAAGRQVDTMCMASRIGLPCDPR